MVYLCLIFFSNRFLGSFGFFVLDASTAKPINPYFNSCLVHIRFIRCFVAWKSSKRLCLRYLEFHVFLFICVLSQSTFTPSFMFTKKNGFLKRLQKQRLFSIKHSKNYGWAGKGSPLHPQNGLGGIWIREHSHLMLSFPRPPRCQRGDHTRLIYQPSATHSTNRKHLSIMHQRTTESNYSFLCGVQIPPRLFLCSFSLRVKIGRVSYFSSKGFAT